MEVRIGVTHASRELTLESSQSAEEIRGQVSEALEAKDGLLTLEDNRGRVVCVPVEKLAYVEIAGETGRRMGFAR